MGIWIGAVATLLLEGSSSRSIAVAGDATAISMSVDKNRFRMISPRRRRAIPLIGRSFVDFLQLIEKQAAAEHARRPSIASAHVNFSTLFPALNRRRHFSIAPLVPPHQLNSTRDQLSIPPGSIKLLTAMLTW
jgi:hypothetical protein